MPQITPFARAALIEFLVLSLFTGQMSKLPPHGTSPAGPARAPGGQRVPPRPGGCRAALPDQAGRGTVTYPPGRAPLRRSPGPEPGPGPAGGGRANLGAGTCGVESSQNPQQAPSPAQRPFPEGCGGRGISRPRLSCSPRLWPAPGGRSPCNL